MASTTKRFVSAPNQDNTYSVVTRDNQYPAFASTYNVETYADITTIQPALLTGAVTVNIDTTYCQIGDTVEFLFKNDGTSRTVTFGTGCAVSASTLVTVAGKYGSIKFKYFGDLWVELGRSLTA